MVEGGPIDVLTGDWLAELTMLILWKAKARNADAGYATTFLTQMEQVLGTCVDRGIKVVSNAGGLNPAGCAERCATSPRGSASTSRRPHRGRRPPRSRRRAAPAPRSPRHRRTADRRPGERQRLPRRLGHRCRARRRRRRRRVPARHRRRARRRTRRRGGGAGRRPTGTAWPAPSSPATSSSADRRRPAATTPSSASCPTCRRPLGFPIAEVDRRRLVGDHQAPRHRRAGLRRRP